MIFIGLVDVTILLTIALASTQSFPSAQNESDGNLAIMTTENMTADNVSDGENASELNDNGNVSSLRGRQPVIMMTENITADNDNYGENATALMNQSQT